MSKKLDGRKMRYEVKPCPLCGYRVKIRERRNLVCCWYTIQCGKCQVSLPEARKLPALVRRWNKRAHELELTHCREVIRAYERDKACEQ